MNQYEIIDMFYRNELKPDQVFVKYMDPPPHMRVAYVELKVCESGNSLTCTRYNRKKEIIELQWILWKENLTPDGFQITNKHWYRSRD